LARAIRGHLRSHNKWTRVPVLRFEPATAAMFFDMVKQDSDEVMQEEEI
jgi:hypothetical protein